MILFIALMLNQGNGQSCQIEDVKGDFRIGWKLIRIKKFDIRLREVMID